MEKGRLIVISGPSGVGKGTIVHKLLNMDNNLVISISATTRAKRLGEVDGIDYHFLTNEEFEEKIRNNEFAEYAKYANNYYGTLCSTIDKIVAKGKNLILEIEVQGAMQIKEKYPNAKLIFIMPPSLAELKKRLQERNTENPETINLRLAQVDREILKSKEFDSIIVNDDLQLATMAVHEEIYS